MTPQDAYADIAGRVASWAKGELCDPPLQSDLLTAALVEIRDLADGGIVVDDTGADHWVPLAQEWAWQLLLAMQRRAATGIPFGEPSEPSWSLDPEPHRMPTKR